MQVESHDGGLTPLLGRILVFVACGLGLAFAVVMLASLAPGSETAHAEAPSEHSAPPPVRSADALVSDAKSPHTGGRRMTGPARPASIDDRPDAMASALRADPIAASAAANRRAAGATTPSVMAATPSPGSHRAPSDSPGDFGPHRGAPAPTSLSTTSMPGSFSGGGGATDSGPSLTMAAVLSAALAAVLWLSQLLRAGEVQWRSTLLTLSIERPG